jgi:RNA polymerase sigma factor (sigma-70 family)
MDATEYQKEKTKWLPVLRAWQKAEGRAKSNLGGQLLQILNRFIESEAFPYARNFPQQKEDILQAVRIAVIEAATRWKEEVSEEFPSYARFWVKVEMRKLNRTSLQKVFHTPQKTPDGQPIRTQAHRLDFHEPEDTVASKTLLQFGLVDENGAVANLEVRDQKRQLTQAIRTLSKNQKLIITERLSGKTQRTIAKERSITHQAVSLAETSAVSDIRTFLTKRKRSI